MVKRAANPVQDPSSKAIGELTGGSERRSRSRARSVPLPAEISVLDCVLQAPSKKRKTLVASLDAENAPPSSLPTIVVARGHKRPTSSNVIPEPHNISGEPTTFETGPTNQPPRKKRKRSSSTPPVPKPSTVATQLRTRSRRAQSRSVSSTPDPTFEFLPPSRISARLARKTHPYIVSRSSDIYAHLADPNGSGHLLSDPPIGSIILNTPRISPVPPLQPAKKPRGRPRKIVDLNDEKTKGALMQEWARIRQSQGTLPATAEPVRETQDGGHPLIDSQHNEADNSPLPRTPAVVTQMNSPEPEVDSSQAMPFDMQTRDTLVDETPENPGYASPDASKILEFDFSDVSQLASLAYPDSPMARELSMTPTPSAAAEDIRPAPEVSAAMQYEDTPADQQAVPDELTQSSLLPSDLPVEEQENPIPDVPIPALDEISFEAPDAELPQPERPPCVAAPSSGHYSDDDRGIEFDVDCDAEFHMLEVPDVLALPWEPVAPRVYVPPSLGHLIEGMKRQLNAEAHARRKAEELHLAELSRRVAAERALQDLRAELEQTLNRSGASCSQSEAQSSVVVSTIRSVDNLTPCTDRTRRHTYGSASIMQGPSTPSGSVPRPEATQSTEDGAKDAMDIA